MISVQKIVGDERVYCTHCGNRACYRLNYLNPRVRQQLPCGVLCERCMKRLKTKVKNAFSS